MTISASEAEALGQRYAQAWCSHDPGLVAGFYAADGRIVINGGDPANGRQEVAAMAQGFFDGFPDLVVHMDDIRSSGTHCVFLWTLEGTNSGPEGTGHAVRVSGWEYWRLNAAGEVVESAGHFDEDDYNAQLAGG